MTLVIGKGEVVKVDSVETIRDGMGGTSGAEARSCVRIYGFIRHASVCYHIKGIVNYPSSARTGSIVRQVISGSALQNILFR
jgi:hypothetical protein